MKNTIVSLALAANTLTACNSGNDSSGESNATKTAPLTEQQTSTIKTTGATPINDIVAGYLQLKNALADDDGQAAADAGEKLAVAMSSLDKSALTPEQQEVYEEVEEDMREHAEHIGENADKIAHQREHFEMLSQDMYDLVKTFDGGQTLYLDYCPMYNNKGATWLSETKEISNPYLGKAMPSCGQVKEEI